jgi:hypothetical protein
MPEYFDYVLSELPSEYEIVALEGAQKVRFSVKSWQVGTKLIHVGSAKTPVEHLAIALEVERLDKPSPHPFWAFTSVNLIAALEPQLVNPATSGGVFQVMAHGKRGARHYSLTAEGA